MFISIFVKINYFRSYFDPLDTHYAALEVETSAMTSSMLKCNNFLVRLLRDAKQNQILHLKPKDMAE